MKKVTSLLLALVMALALAVPAFAETITPDVGGKPSEKDVTANVSVTKDQTVSVYHVTVDWTTPTFSYTFKGMKYTWNTTELCYKGEDIGKTGWGTTGEESQDGALTLKVTNRSDKAVYCKAAIEKNASQTGLNVSYGDKGVKKATADTIVTDSNNPSAYTNPHTGGVPTADLGGKITMSGTPNKPEQTQNGVILATITLTLSQTEIA